VQEHDLKATKVAVATHDFSNKLNSLGAPVVLIVLHSAEEDFL
jgi:hypothetical protein